MARISSNTADLPTYHPQPPSRSEMAPRRPPSPAPSYRTLPPNTHTPFPPSNSDSDSNFNSTPTTQPYTTHALHRAAHETPDAILSKLTITNTSHPPHRGPVNSNPEQDRERSVAASTEGKVRYRVNFPDARTMRVWKVVGVESAVVSGTGTGTGTALTSGQGSGGSDGFGYAEKLHPIATTTVSSQSLSVTFADGSAMDTQFEDLQRSQKMSFLLRADGKERRFAWEIVSKLVDDDEGHPDDGTQKSAKGKAKKPVLGIESKRKKPLQRMVGMRLVDGEGKIWAAYVHDVGERVHSTGKSGRWGTVEIKCRAVLLDEGVDKAFVMLISLLEVYVRLFGGDHPGVEKWGGLAAGVLFCSVM